MESLSGVNLKVNIFKLYNTRSIVIEIGIQSIQVNNCVYYKITNLN